MHHWILTAAAVNPERIALETPGEVLTYTELALRARTAAAALEERGVEAGAHVALALPPDAGFVAALHGCMLAGVIAIPIDLRLAEHERAQRAERAAILVSAPLAGAGGAAASPLELDAVATLMHTSGTTAAPRAVPLTYRNWLAGALGSAVGLGLDRSERWLCPMPLAHVGGLSILIRSAVYGTTAVLHGRFEAEAVLAALMSPSEAITLVSLVPTMLARLLDAGLSAPPALRWALLGGGPIAPALLDRAQAAGVPVAPTYGMTEACSQIATNGWPLPGVDVRLAPDAEVLVRGDTVSSAALDVDGWLHTGDLGSLDDRGRLAIVGRKADTIVSGGENVAPAEVEAALLEHPAVADAGVFARSDPRWGEAVIARVVLRDGVTLPAEQLRAHCAERLARFKVPKTIEFVPGLPRTASGKLVRRELR